MSQVKQRKIDVECRIFNDNWTLKYLIGNIEDKAVFSLQRIYFCF